MCCLVELFVVVNAENGVRPAARCDANSTDLRCEKSCRDAGHDDERAESVEIRDAGANGVARDFGIVPLHGKENRRGSKDAEVEAVVGVFPDVVAINNEILAEGLLEAGVKFVAPARSEWDGQAGTCRIGDDAVDDRIVAN